MDLQIVVYLSVAAAGFDSLSLYIWIGGFNIEDTPVAVAGKIDLHFLIDGRALVNFADLHAAGIHFNVAANRAFNVQLHFGIKRLIDGHCKRGAALAAKRVGIEMGENRAFFIGLKRRIYHTRGSATATRSHSGDVHVFHINIFKYKFVFSSGITGTGAKIVLAYLEHLSGPVLSEYR